jgi:hypothetical protein
MIWTGALEGGMKIDAEVTVDAPIGPVFNLLHDYGRRLDWDPFLSEARIVAGKSGVGCVVRCTERKLGLSMDTEYVSFKFPKLAAVRMTRGPWFLGLFTGTWLLEDLGGARTRVRFHYNVIGGPKILTPLLGLLFRYESRQRLGALQRFISCQLL